MQQLTVIEHANARVLTTSQLADAFDTISKIITRNFQRNKERYQVGRHYFVLAGEDLERFKAERQNVASLKYVSVLYLWTEEGAWLHAKSLSSDKAWEAYQMLVANYYKVTSQIAKKQASVNMSPAISYRQIYQIESRLDALEKQMRDATLHSGEQKRLRNAVGERVHQLTKSQKGARPVLFRSLYGAIREHYEVESYRDVKQHQLQDALLFVSRWGV